VLVVPEQNLSPAEQVNFGARFGVLEPRHPLHKIAEGQEHIMVVENGPERPPDNEDWHADMTYRAAPPRVSILQAKVLPPRGGDTLFSNVHAVYDDLSLAMQRFLQGLTAQHSVATGYRKALVRDPIYEKERLHALEQMDPANSLVVHPVVGHHPVSGRPYLNINQSFTSHVVELTNEESQALLAMLEQRVREPRYQVRHRWSVGDIVMWDNYGAQHYAAGDYSEYRLMHRVTVKYMADGTFPAAISGSDPSPS
jgi:taurine dioxygenase